ncbi:MAG TPA: hypothetical protein VM431_02570 [Phycisphaerae bacterium]|nr:hypothetical protein [Phycisphaerae bacterium]
MLDDEAILAEKKQRQDAVEKAMQRGAMQDVVSRLGLCRDDLLEFCQWGLGVGLPEKEVFRAMRSPEMIEYFFTKRGGGKYTFEFYMKMAAWIIDGPRSRPPN